MQKSQLREIFQKDWEKHYKIDFFEEKGFKRYKCKICGKYFWSLEERDVCEDPSHESYKFIGNKIQELSYTDVWEKMKKGYEKFGIKTIERYPVVARWRDDMEFVIASIACFQPYVVRGEVSPPENPLLIPQPCLRFNDILNIGVTGRHMSCFIMVGHHAFNEQLFYWKNEAVSHTFEVLTKEFKIPEEKIIFIEDVWSGGGNFGPCLEYFADGLELGNIVFMQYAEPFDELKIKVIDHGIGLNRWAWYVNGSINAYEVVFEKPLKYLKNIFGINSEEFKDFFIESSKLDIEEVEDQETKVKEILEKYSLNYEDFEILKNIYCICDHTRTLLFAINDGMLPSNVGGGYNLRYLCRRIFNMNLEFDYGKVFELHVEQLKPMFELDSQIPIEVFEEEYKKYKQTLEEGKRRVINILEKKGKLDLEDFVLLYDSHGLIPEFVEKISGIKAPKEVYKKVLELHEKVKKEEKVEEYPYETELKCYENVFEFEAKVVDIIEKDGKTYLILDKTYFYPEGGGQESDQGWINNVFVPYVYKVGKTVLHQVEKNIFEKGQTVKCKIDIERRKTLEKMHSATHILEYCCEKILGKHVWQQGTKKTTEISHLDINHYKPLTKEIINRIETEANQMVMECIPVEIEYLERTEAEKKYGIKIYQGGFVPGKILRIVKIGDSIEACAGTHVKNTGEIGLIKIVKVEKVKDNIYRIYYKAGIPALKYCQKMQNTLEELSQKMSCDIFEVVKGYEKILEMWKNERKEKERLLEIISKSKKMMLKGENIKYGVFEECSVKEAREIYEEIKQPLIIISKNTKPNLIVFESEDLFNKIIEKFGGKGGFSKGSGYAVLEKIPEEKDLEELIK